MNRCAKMSRLLFIAGVQKKDWRPALSERTWSTSASCRKGSMEIKRLENGHKHWQRNGVAFSIVRLPLFVWNCLEEGKCQPDIWVWSCCTPHSCSEGWWTTWAPAKNISFWSDRYFFCNSYPLKSRRIVFHVDIIRFPSDRTYPTSLFFRRLVSRHVEMSVFVKF